MPDCNFGRPQHFDPEGRKIPVAIGGGVWYTVLISVSDGKPARPGGACPGGGLGEHTRVRGKLPGGHPGPGGAGAGAVHRRGPAAGLLQAQRPSTSSGRTSTGTWGWNKKRRGRIWAVPVVFAFRASFTFSPRFRVVTLRSGRDARSLSLRFKQNPVPLRGPWAFAFTPLQAPSPSASPRFRFPRTGSGRTVPAPRPGCPSGPGPTSAW